MFHLCSHRHSIAIARPTREHDTWSHFPRAFPLLFCFSFQLICCLTNVAGMFCCARNPRILCTRAIVEGFIPQYIFACASFSKQAQHTSISEKHSSTRTQNKIRPHFRLTLLVATNLSYIKHSLPRGIDRYKQNRFPSFNSKHHGQAQHRCSCRHWRRRVALR